MIHKLLEIAKSSSDVRKGIDVNFLGMMNYAVFGMTLGEEGG